MSKRTAILVAFLLLFFVIVFSMMYRQLVALQQRTTQTVPPRR